ncbi:TraR/DksA family transcriptional regulator, partial [Pseudomonas aeruginosa]
MADLADHANELVLARLDGLLAARPALAIRESAEDCEDCGEPIP